MKTVLRSTIVSVFLVIGLLASAQPGSKGLREIATKDDPDLKLIADHLKQTQSYEADFTQTRHLSLFKDVLKSSGRIYFQLPDKLRWETTSPYVSILITNGGRVARFVSEENHLKKMELGNQEMFHQITEEMTGIMRGDFQNLFATYKMFLSESKDYLLLRPRKEDVQRSIETLEFAIDPPTGRVKQVIIREPEQDFVQIDFTNPKMNTHLDSSIFSLDSPKLP